MKKFFVITLAVLFSAVALNAQKIGYVNSETILNSLPSYTAAQQQLETLAGQYKSTLDKQLAQVENLYNAYQQQKSRLSASQRSTKENEIISLERSVKQRQEQYFGENGAMAKRQAELIDPIRKQVENAIDNFAKQHGYTLILDITGAPGVMYLDERADVTQQIINLLK